MIEAVVVTANQRAYLAMRTLEGMNDGVARLDDAGTKNAGFKDEWAEFRASLPEGKGAHHVIQPEMADTAEPAVNVVELDDDKGQRSIWIARGFKEIGEARDADAKVVVVTDKAKAIALAAKGAAAAARQEDIDAAAATLPLGFSVSFMEAAQSAPVHDTLDAYSDMETGV